MATVILSSLGSAVGGAFGGPIGALIGQTIGAVVGSQIDQALFTPTIKSTQEGPRLQQANVLSSVEGLDIVRGYGRFRVSGNVIWATRLLEEVVKETTKSGGKGGGAPKTKSTTITYNYYANFAIGLCEGEILNIHRVWADGKLLDLTEYTYRVYKGTNSQSPDSLIESKEGSNNAPGYRGLAYIVFESMLLERFGNRIPQLSFEVTRPITRSDSDGVGDLITGIDLIPGTTEFGYDPNVVTQTIFGSDEQTSVVEKRVENNHSSDGRSDWNHALEQLETNLPNCNIVTFVVTWFGDDLRIGNCTIRPKVENSTKETTPISWEVSGLARSDALVISTYEGNPAFGGTPNDLSIYRAILDLKSRGFEVMFYPFIIMDIDGDNTLPNPYSDNAAGNGQAVYPWRGRITCSPAQGYAGTVDKSASAATQISSFLGTATSANFSGSSGEVTYSGANEWSYRRFILHMAEICRQAGGVDYFCIGSEMVGATTVRDGSNNFPFVDGLVSLAAQVTNLLSSTEIGYAADWSEYHSHRPSDGTNDVYFHLDSLWSDSNIDFIGIDNYMPLSDWRDSDDHTDYLAGNNSIYDLDYLKSNIEGGEYYDWFYNSFSDRLSQTRTEIDDTAESKDWVFRQKDIKNWWLNSHYNRPAGTESGSPTSWTAESKPVIFTEFGCPALDKGTNQPNVFFDPKSSESFVPYFSSGGRDDEIQRQYIRAVMEYWTDNSNNPASGVYSGRMIDASRMSYWSYDARPWPTFPTDGDSWADQPNWQFGHWISGRIDTVYIPDLLSELAEDYNITASYDFSGAYGSCDGFVVQRKTSFRSTVEPLASLFLFDIIESGDTIKAVSQVEVQSLETLTLRDISEAQGDNDEPIMFTRSQESELPVAMTIRFIDIFNDYNTASVKQKRETVEAESEPLSETPIVLDFARAQQLVDRLLYSAWAKRNRADFGVLPEFLKLEPGDVVTVNDNGFNELVRIETVTDGAYRQITGRSFDLGIFQQGGGSSRTQPINIQPIASSVVIAFMDLPILDSEAVPYRPYVASYLSPWPGANVYKSVTNSNFVIDTTVLGPATMGELTDAFDSGPTAVWDNANELKIKIYSDELETLEELNVLNGGNAVAIETSSGNWEIVQYVNATLTGSRTYTLTKLLRGQLGTEDGIEATVAVGARVVILDSTVEQLNLGINDLDRQYYFRYGPADRDIGDETYLTTTQTFEGRGLKPYSPVHVEGVDDGGDITLSWIRRTRINGDNWEYTDDVPLNEAFEKYEIDILDGSDNVVRTISVTDATSTVYTAAQQSTDSITTPFDCVVYQMSDQVGRGIGRRTTING